MPYTAFLDRVGIRWGAEVYMTDLEYDTALAAGTWYLWRTARRRILVSCPACAGLVLVEVDDVNEDGTVMPEFSCKRSECTFKDEVRLRGWRSGGSE